MTLSLESFRQQFSMMPWHFWQLSSAAHFPVNDDCNDLVYQYAWQANDSAGRSDLARAIANAEQRLSEHLEYSPTPHFNTATVKFPQIPDPTLQRANYAGSDSRFLSVKLPEGKIKRVGVEVRTLIDTMALTYSDADGDGVDDTFTGSVSTTITDVSQIEVEFASADRWDGSGPGDKWVIDPLNIVIAAGTATITGHAWQAVLPALYESGAAIDPVDSANFAASLDVFWHYCDPTGFTRDTAQAVLIWETRPFPFWATCLNCNSQSINSSDTDPAAVSYALARVGLRNADLGIVLIGEAIYNAANGMWGAVNMSNCRPPDRIDIRYKAGISLDANGLITQKWQGIIARLAAAELGKRVCACNSANRMIYEQQIDRAFGGDARVEKFKMTADEEKSPFGYREGAIYAWRQVKHLRQLIGVRP